MFLPIELYETIIEQIAPDDPLRQSTILSLTRALPYIPALQTYLFRGIILSRAEQAIQLTLRLLKTDGDEVSLCVQEFCWHNEWTVDAEVVVNLLRKLPGLRSLSLCIGTNFAPEHLEAIFKTPRPDLRYLSLRFRPYVQKATYQRFLSGSYFDSTLACLAEWPPSDLPTLSVVQEAMEPAQAPHISFAQPIVFFRLDKHLADLAHSSYLFSLTSLRLRIPSRPVAGALASLPLSLPSVELLDLSTCNVFGAELTDTLLARLTRLKHVILDNGTLLRKEYDPEDWAVLGKGCALAGVKRTKEREKKLRQARLQTVPVAAPERQARPGRKGVSTAKISLRASPPRQSRVVGVVDTPAASGMRKVRLYPGLPSLCSLATTLPASVPPGKHAEIRQQFEKGWYEGLRQLVETRSRLYKSHGLESATIMKYMDAEETNGSEEGLDGLVEVTEWDDDLDIKAPVLCLAGPEKSAVHEAGCAHSVAWTVWKD
ncbi:hypothetical protein GGX14DRAFT_460461 [Mycena pura]|uniref:F-box domain-containing protein n=1 Tax=Mycena pura TaxID=153505 RepID=A0AAD6YBT1_9AGAR|nr:hypothetical protein GGX14DRAFT_460461 [Mycena pura]